MSIEKEKQELKAAILILMETVLSLIQDDPHQWSKRPCPTCRAVSSMIGTDFGCNLFEKEKK